MISVERQVHIRRGIEAVTTRRSWKTIVLITANSPKPLILLGFSHFFLHFARWASRSFLAIFLISYFGICWPFGQFDTRRVIEAVITRWSWKPFAGNGAWVRISHPPPHRGQDGSLDPVFLLIRLLLLTEPYRWSLRFPACFRCPHAHKYLP